MKRPSFQFYPGDWLNDASVRMVSVGARGLWIDMICIMHQGSEYGHLKVNGKVILPANLARMVGSTLAEVEGYLEELESAGVFAKSEDGDIYSRRMIRDEEIREARAAGGIKGGNPALMGKKKVNLPPNLEPTPSSSSSSSSSSTTKDSKANARGSRLPADWTPTESDVAFIRKERPDLELNNTVGQFRDYWGSVAGQKALKTDWPATWRNWVRNQRAPGGGGGGGGNFHDDRKRVMDELTGRNRHAATEDFTIIDI